MHPKELFVFFWKTGIEVYLHKNKAWAMLELNLVLVNFIRLFF